MEHIRVREPRGRRTRARVALSSHKLPALAAIAIEHFIDVVAGFCLEMMYSHFDGRHLSQRITHEERSPSLLLSFLFVNY